MSGYSRRTICYTHTHTHTHVCVCVPSSFSCVSLCVTLWTVAPQTPLSKGFSRQEHWSELPCPPPGDLSNPGIQPKFLASSALADKFFTTVPPGKPIYIHICNMNTMAPHSSTLAWKIPWMEEPGRLQSMGSLRVGHDWATSLSCIGEGNGNPLQYSCLENPRDGGFWWAAIYGVTQSRTWLQQLSSSNSIIL